MDKDPLWSRTAHDAAQHAMTSLSRETRASGGTGQARRRIGRIPHLRGVALGLALAALGLAALGLAACAGPDPIERARLAAGRAPTTTLPPVPGEGQPYPNLGTVPARPATIEPAERRALEDALVADRANARYVGQPVVPTVPRAAPAAATLPPAAAPLEAAGGMLMGAEETTPPPLGVQPAPPIAGAPVTAEALPPPPAAPPPPPGPIADAPRAAGAGIALEELPPPPAPAMPEELSARALAAASAPLAPSPTAIAAPAPPPAPTPLAAALPASPPPIAPMAAAPVLLPAGPREAPTPAPVAAPTLAPIPAPAMAAAPPPPPPPAPPQPSVVVDRGALLATRPSPTDQAYALAFLPGTETLVMRDRAVLAGLAARGSGATFRVTGFSDEAGSGRALDLPLARARVVADALRAAGVPADAIELGGAARQGPAGRGAEVRLVYSR
jgi:outer membrane protein OmpA-like peptidoglycan-associated protein